MITDTHVRKPVIIDTKWRTPVTSNEPDCMNVVNGMTREHQNLLNVGPLGCVSLNVSPPVSLHVSPPVSLNVYLPVYLNVSLHVSEPKPLWPLCFLRKTSLLPNLCQ